MQKKSIWEVDSRFYCSLIGLCLSEKEQTKLVKKSIFSLQEKSAYIIHEKVVAGVQNRSSLARKTQQLLNNKYRQEITLWDALTPFEQQNEWKKQLKAYNVAPFLWAALINPHTPNMLLTEMVGDLHIYPFQVGEHFYNLVTKTDTQIKKQTHLQEKVTILQKQQLELKQLLRANEQKLQQTLRENALLQKRLSTINKAEPAANYRERYESMRLKNENLTQLLTQRESQIAQLKTEKAVLPKDFVKPIATPSPTRSEGILTAAEQEEICLSCPNYNLCSKRVLMVGGVSKLYAHYKTVVEEMGGQFEYHDGFRMDDKKMAKMVHKNDIILCPIDVNSHQACTILKKQCKKAGKPYYMMRSSSLNTLGQTLENLAKDMTC